MALPTENPHSRRKPGPTLQRPRRGKSGSRLSPGMRIFLVATPLRPLRVLCALSDKAFVFFFRSPPVGGAGLGPAFGVLQKAFDRGVLAGGEAAEALGGRRHIPPGGE